MTNHTPGPWKRLTDEDGEIWVIADDDHRYNIANMEGSCKECHANASLIAAAPELLQALSFAKSVIQSGEEWTGTCERVIQGAINKAKGKEL